MCYNQRQYENTSTDKEDILKNVDILIEKIILWKVTEVAFIM